MKKMNKLVSLLLALAMCFLLAACGGPNKQPAIDAFNKASDAFNEVSAIMNQDPETYGVYYDAMIEYAEILNEVGSTLKNNDLDQATLDALVSGCKDIEEWSIELKAALEE